MGRAQEKADLAQLWNRAKDGELTIALVGGEPGAGKTRLVREMSKEAHNQGATVLYGRCDEDLGVPYQPFVEALRFFVEKSPEPSAHLGRLPMELARLVPDLPIDRSTTAPSSDGRRPATDPETERYHLFEALLSWLEAAAEESLVLVVDDLHWATKETMQLLRHIMRGQSTAPIMVMGTYRDVESERSAELADLLAEASRESNVLFVELGGLEAADIAHLLDDLDIESSSTSLASAIQDQTGGNAYFIGELMLQLADAEPDETGARPRCLGRSRRSSWDGSTGCRPRPARPWRWRRRPGPRSKSTCWPERWRCPYRTWSIRSGRRAAPACHASCPSRRCATGSSTPSCAPRSTSTRRSTEGADTTTSSGIAIEDRHAGRIGEHLDDLAFHFARSSDERDISKLIRYARDAGDRAMTQVAYDEAVSFYRLALDAIERPGSSPDPHLLLETLVELGRAQRRGHLHDGRGTLLRAADMAAALGDRDQLIAAALANTRTVFWTGEPTDPERSLVFERALHQLDPGDSTERAQLTACLSVERYLASDEADHLLLADEALAISRRMQRPDRPRVRPALPQPHDVAARHGRRAARSGQGDPRPGPGTGLGEPLRARHMGLPRVQRRHRGR